jgi:glycosyltransferase involved in cell wall biosynthesis
VTGSAIVSVVIPAYNAAGFIGRTLDTVRSQTYRQHETIIVDDGSTDETTTAAQAYLEQHGMRGQVVRQENRGIAAARNVGMRTATGTHVALLDHDDLWYPEKLAAVMAEFEHHPEADLVCHNENITRGGEIVRVSRRRLSRANTYEALLFDGNLLSPSATTVRREAALALGGFDERPEYLTVEDYDFWMRFSRERQIRFLDRVLGEYVLVDRAASRRIVFHHIALEGMLRNHLSAYSLTHVGLRTRLRVRRRLAQVYRSAARQLIAHGEAADDQQALVARMLKTYPFEPRNVVVAVMWIAARLRRLSMVAVQP